MHNVNSLNVNELTFEVGNQERFTEEKQWILTVLLDALVFASFKQRHWKHVRKHASETNKSDDDSGNEAYWRASTSGELFAGKGRVNWLFEEHRNQLDSDSTHHRLWA